MNIDTYVFESGDEKLHFVIDRSGYNISLNNSKSIHIPAYLYSAGVASIKKGVKPFDVWAAIYKGLKGK